MYKRQNLDLEEYNEAILDFNKAIELDKSQFKNYYYRGLAYYKLQQYKEAIDDFSVAIEGDPSDIRAYEKRGDAYCQTGDYDNAIKDFFMISRLEEKN